MDVKKFLKDCYAAMMAGISYMVPVIVSGGILQAIPNLWTNGAAAEAVEGTIAFTMYSWGSSLFGMMYYVLGMFVAFAIAGRGAFVPGLMVGLIAVNGSSGFLGALVGGIIAGYLVKSVLMKLKLPSVLQSAKPVLIIPLLSAAIMMFLMVFMIEPVCGWLMNLIYDAGRFVESIGYNWLLYAFFGICVCFGMGGPIIAGTVPLMLALIADGNVEVAAVMNCTACASCYGTALATVLFKKKYRPDQRANLPGLLTGGICQITEFQIPFLMDDIKVMTPCYILSGALGGIMVALTGVTTPTFHGGIFTAFLASSVPLHLLCILVQASFTCLFIGIFKKNLSEENEEVSELVAE